MPRFPEFETGAIVKVVLDIPQGHFVNYYKVNFSFNIKGRFTLLLGSIKEEIIEAKWAKIEPIDKFDLTILKLAGKIKKEDNV